MKEVTIKIPDKKLKFFLALVKELGLETTEETTIPEEHKKIVRDRVKKSEQDPDRLLDWEKAKDSFKFD